MVIKRIKDIFRPVLSDDTIMKYNRRGILIEESIPIEQLQPNSVDLTVDNEMLFINPNKMSDHVDIIDPKSKAPIRYSHWIAQDNDPLIIAPGEFVLLSSRETLNIPNGIIAFVQGRSSIARMGLQTEQAGLIDSGFEGNITFECFNETKYGIKLYPGMRIAQVYFFKSQYASHVYGSKNSNSKYNNQTGPTETRIQSDFKRKEDV